ALSATTATRIGFVLILPNRPYAIKAVYKMAILWKATIEMMEIMDNGSMINNTGLRLPILSAMILNMIDPGIAAQGTREATTPTELPSIPRASAKYSGSHVTTTKNP